MQTCIWASGFHCHSLSLASVKSRLVLPFWYRLTQVVPEEGPLNWCVCVCVCVHWIHTDKTSLCSASYDNVALSTFGRRMPCCHAASAGDIAIDRYLLPAGPTAANPPQLHVQWQKWNSSNCCKNTAQWQVILNILVLVGFVNYSLKTVLLDTVQGTRRTEDHLNDETLLNGLDWSCMKHSTWPKIKVGEVLHSASMVIRPWEERQTRAITYFQTHKYKTLNCLQHVQLK